MKQRNGRISIAGRVDDDRLRAATASALRRALAAAGLTQTEAARRCGCAQASLSYILNEKNLPSLTLLIALGEVLDDTAADIVRGIEDEYRL